MATNFMSLNDEKQKSEKTVFEKMVNCNLQIENDSLQIENALYTPDDFENILFIGNDEWYGDVFKAWDDDKNNFFIFFGVKGNEFNK